MEKQGQVVASGVSRLDRLLGGLFFGDNVVWHDDAGSLATPFCLSFLRASREQGCPLIYVSFDRSPNNLLDRMGDLAQYPLLTILACFTHGKGQSSEVFRRFYQEPMRDVDCRVVPLDSPHSPEAVAQACYSLHGAQQEGVRFVFDSLTGMQDLWGGERGLLDFYASSSPQLCQLQTITYWIMGKQAHSSELRAQAAVDLALRRGTTSLTIVKADRRQAECLHQPQCYWTKGEEIAFDAQQRAGGLQELGQRLRGLRARKGLSQTELARLVGVTPSTISQVESNLIYPSLPALVKMAEVLSVEVSSFFNGKGQDDNPVVFPASGARPLELAETPPETARCWDLTPAEFRRRAEPLILEVAPKQSLSGHFCAHKGEEMGYVLAGRLQLKVGLASYTARAGDVIYLTSESPNQWSNPGRSPTRLLWLKIR